MTDAVAASAHAGNVVYASESPLLLEEVRRLDQRALLAGIASSEQGMAPQVALPLHALLAKRDLVSDAFRRDLCSRGVSLWAWTVETEADLAPLLAARVDAVLAEIPSRCR